MPPVTNADLALALPIIGAAAFKAAISAAFNDL